MLPQAESALNAGDRVSRVITNSFELLPAERHVARQRLPIIRASEMGEYVYCARAWWLRRVEGLEPAGRERREQGVVLHHRHGRAVAGSRALLLLGGVLALAALALILMGR